MKVTRDIITEIQQAQQNTSHKMYQINATRGVIT